MFGKSTEARPGRQTTVNSQYLTSRFIAGWDDWALQRRLGAGSLGLATPGTLKDWVSGVGYSRDTQGLGPGDRAETGREVWLRF